MTRVKICGITSLYDARLATNAGADALGFVFAPSARRVAPDTAASIIDRLPPLITTVGVFVDATTADIESVISQTKIHVVQLHGVEGPEDCAAIAAPVVKRFRVSPDDTASDIVSRVAGYDVSACLLDPGAGSGETFAWSLARAVAGPVIVAGGLNPANVRAAVAAVEPYGVDVCSGVEFRPGIKDAEKVRAFVRAVREQDVANRSTTNIA